MFKQMTVMTAIHPLDTLRSFAQCLESPEGVTLEMIGRALLSTARASFCSAGRKHQTILCAQSFKMARSVIVQPIA